MSTMNILEIVNNNRPFTDHQLTSDDLGKKWEEYRNICDNLAVGAWKSIRRNDDTLLGKALTDLFTFLGIDCKATTSYKKRAVLACVERKIVMSDAYKAAKTDLRNAEKALSLIEEKLEEEPENPEYLSAKSVNESMVQDAQDKVDELAALPWNRWYEKRPMLDTSMTHATKKARKNIEDMASNIASERDIMSIEDLRLEAAALKAERKERKAIKAEKAEENTAK